MGQEKSRWQGRAARHIHQWTVATPSDQHHERRPRHRGLAQQSTAMGRGSICDEKANVAQLGNQSTSMHWHGLYQNGTSSMDGAVGVTQCDIPPGRSMTYNFTVCPIFFLSNDDALTSSRSSSRVLTGIIHTSRDSIRTAGVVNSSFTTRKTLMLMSTMRRSQSRCRTGTTMRCLA